MSRISIEVNEKLHRQIKAMAALEGMNIKEFVLDKIMSSAPRKKGAKQKKPNARLSRAIRDAEAGRNLIRYNSLEEMFAAWRAEGR